MPWTESADGWKYDPNGTARVISTTLGVFSPVSIAKKLFKLCWSVAHIASYLNVTQEEVKEMLDQ